MPPDTKKAAKSANHGLLSHSAIRRASAGAALNCCVKVSWWHHRRTIAARRLVGRAPDRKQTQTYLIEVRVPKSVDAAYQARTRVIMSVRSCGVHGPLAQPVSLQISHVACSHGAAKSATATIGGPAAANIAKISASATIPRARLAAAAPRFKNRRTSTHYSPFRECVFYALGAD